MKAILKWKGLVKNNKIKSNSRMEEDCRNDLDDQNHSSNEEEVKMEKLGQSEMRDIEEEQLCGK